LTRAGLHVPAFRTISIAEDAAAIAVSLSYPAVLKPLAMSGSRGVIRADDAREFIRAFDRIRKLLEQRDVRAERDSVHERLIIESFIPGTEYAVEVVY
jgi:biotin carboxylase